MGSTDLPSALFKEIVADVHNIQVSRYTMLALSILYIYDLVTTLDQEVELVWKKPKSLLSVLFFLNRYVPLCAAVIGPAVFLISTPELTNSVCENWMKYMCGESVVTLATIHVILVIRVWAIYQRSMRILIPLVVFGMCSFISYSTIILAGNIRPSNAEPVPGFFTCTFEEPSWYAATWLPLLAFETTLFILVLWRGYQMFRKSDSIVPISGTSGRRLAQVLVRDSVIYYLSTGMVLVMNTCMWYWADGSLLESSSSYALFLPPIVTSKLLLNLRAEIFSPDQNTVEFSTFRAAVHENSELDTFTAHIERWEEWSPNTGA
ncbi:hypothetical protein GYMLUDRAFT_43546 [Collybiopsis luxurians FD-317 M1]|uniref:Unplaced genomic scaffold GYMLUscaffold_26, whole genome shotgun sequence n=1 Tax=Collybiopsis luxurians FD-317 M1 TaxID=944289 RepID=A0A0D0CE00_9AGAR|nr:hypothetical protein GYMLUDRAFT_43546 [Collybiopsis luxurians FD-317 M1]